MDVLEQSSRAAYRDRMAKPPCDWCGKDAGEEERFRAFKPHRGCAQPMYACSGCVEGAERFAALTNGRPNGSSPLDGSPILTVQVDGRSPVTLKEGKAARAYLKEAIGFKRAAKPTGKAPAKVSASQARDIATAALSLIGMSFPRTPAEADAILAELKVGAVA